MPAFACKLSHPYPSWIAHYLKSLKEMIVTLNIFQGMINFGQSLVLRRQTQRLGGWTELDLATRESWCCWWGLWGSISADWGRVRQYVSTATLTGSAKESTAHWRLWVSCSKPQSDKKHWPSTHFCRDPLGIIVFDFVKGTSVMTGAFSRAPQDVDLALSPRSLPWGGGTRSLTPNTHTHTEVCTYLPPLKSQRRIQVPGKLYKQNIGEIQ